MKYKIRFLARALKDLDGLEAKLKERILDRIDDLKDDLGGDVKKLTQFSPKYRLRVGDFRVLFDIEKEEIVIINVLHRSKAYQR